jgi:hypothetical protein
VTVKYETSNPFTFVTNPGHLLYPATITFTGVDTGAGQIQFSIDINGDYASVSDRLKFYFGVGNFEDKQWDHFSSQVVAHCHQ